MEQSADELEVDDTLEWDGFEEFMSSSLEERRKKFFVLLMFFLSTSSQRKAIGQLLPAMCSEVVDLREKFSPILRVSCLQKGGADFFFERADDTSLEKVTRLNRETFQLLYDHFYEAWQQTPLPNSSQGSSIVRIRRRCLSAQASLGICLFFLAYCPPLTALCLFSGVSQPSISRYLQHSLQILLSVLRMLPGGEVACPSAETLSFIGNEVARIYHEVMRGCVIVTDGSLHHLEHDNLAQNNFWFDEWHLDYNGYA